MADETDLSNTDLHSKVETPNLTPQDSDEAIAALDKLAAEEGGEQTPPPDDAAAKAKQAEEEAAKAKAAEEAAKAKSAEEEAAKAKAAEAETAKAKAAEEEAAKAAEAAKNKDALDDIQLPPHTSPKAADSFAALKQKARETQAALQKQLEEATAKATAAAAELEQLRPKVGAVPEDVTAELEDLRKFKLAHDVESDPTFKEFDGQLNSNREAIYKRLAAAGMAPEKIEQIKQLGGPENVDWDPVFAKMSVGLRRFIESTLVENERLVDKREAALAKAKENATSFLKEREGREVKVVTDAANDFLKQLPWTAQKAVPANATPEQKAAIEADNKFAGEAQGLLKEYLSDRTPVRYAELAVCALIAHRQKAELATVQQRLTAKEAALAEVTKERDKLKADLDRIRTAEIPRPKNGGSEIPAVKTPGINVSGEEALESLLQQELATQN
jgi:hypothetical protein